ncbi:glycosyltransferase family 9 protein [candidate division KSB1 bacterium]
MPVIENNPYINKIHVLDKKLKSIIPSLKAENFDHIIDLHKNIRSVFIRMQLRKPSSSFPKLNFKKWLYIYFRINLLPKIHIVDRYFKAARFLRLENDGKGLDYFLNSEEDKLPEDIPSPFHSHYVGFVIGGKHRTKILPTEKIISICKKIKKPIILLGGQEDKIKGEIIRETSGSHVFNACGRFSINQSAFLVKNADSIITHDTGLMHIAAAYKKKIISVWGNTIPDFGMYPYLPEEFKDRSSIFEIKKLSCRPCSKLGYKECPAGHFKCMQLIDEDGIAAKIN